MTHRSLKRYDYDSKGRWMWSAQSSDEGAQASSVKRRERRTFAAAINKELQSLRNQPVACKHQLYVIQASLAQLGGSLKEPNVQVGARQIWQACETKIVEVPSTLKFQRYKSLKSRRSTHVRRMHFQPLGGRIMCLIFH